MDCYEIWVDLVPGTKDMDFVDAVHGWLGYLQSKGEIESYRIKRRKLGFGPDFLGEWYISIEFQDLSQVDRAFHDAASRLPEVEALHAAVYSKVCNYRSGLWRDFPDKVRQG